MGHGRSGKAANRSLQTPTACLLTGISALLTGHSQSGGGESAEVCLIVLRLPTIRVATRCLHGQQSVGQMHHASLLVAKYPPMQEFTLQTRKRHPEINGIAASTAIQKHNRTLRSAASVHVGSRNKYCSSWAAGQGRVKGSGRFDWCSLPRWVKHDAVEANAEGELWVTSALR